MASRKGRVTFLNLISWLQGGNGLCLQGGRQRGSWVCLGFKGSTWSLCSHSLCWQFVKPSLREVAEFLETQHTGLGCFPWFHSKCLVPLFSWPAPRCHFDLTGSREAWTLKSWRTHHPSITPLFPRERAHVSRVAVWRNMMCKRRCDTRESYSVSFSSGATPPSAQSCLNVNIWVILMWPKLPQRTYLQVGFPL